MNWKEAIDSEDFQQFIEACRDYCTLLENRTKSSSLLQVQKALLNLYSKGLNLQTIDLVSNEDFQEKADNDLFESVKQQTAELIGKQQYYRSIFDPTENVFGSEKPVIGDLLDDIMDIYKDLKHQLMIFDLNTEDSMESAIWSMKSDFWFHWSHHAIDAMRTIHYIIEKTEKHK